MPTTEQWNRERRQQEHRNILGLVQTEKQEDSTKEPINERHETKSLGVETDDENEPKGHGKTTEFYVYEAMLKRNEAGRFTVWLKSSRDVCVDHMWPRDGAQ